MAKIVPVCTLLILAQHHIDIKITTNNKIIEANIKESKVSTLREFE
jgi:hypothetical protein